MKLVPALPDQKNLPKAKAVCHVSSQWRTERVEPDIAILRAKGPASKTEIHAMNLRSFHPQSIFLCSALCLTGLNAGLAAQTNLLTNGDFSASAFQITPWTTSGFALAKKVGKAKTDGATSSWAYEFTCDHVQRHILAQSVALQSGKSYVIRAEFESEIIAYCFPNVTVQVKLGATWVSTSSPMPLHIAAVGAKSTLALTSIANLTQAASEFRIVYYNARNGGRTLIRTDNVSITELGTGPLLASGTNRQLASWGTKPLDIKYELHGTPGITHLVLLSPRLVTAPVTIPGITNPLWLDLNIGFPLTQLVTNANGYGSTTVTYPNAAVAANLGLPLHFQVLGANLIAGIAVLGAPVIMSFPQ